MKKYKCFIRLIALAVCFCITFIFLNGCKENENKQVNKDGVLMNADALTKGKAHVIILSGQSNATGQTLLSYLKQTATEKDYAEYEKGYNNVFIKYKVDDATNSSKDFVPVTLGQGARRDKFGPEVGIASYLSKQFPEENFYIIKASWSGAGIAAHLGEQNHEYKEIINRFDEAFKLLEEKGLEPELFAFCWMQGETDALSMQNADNYYNLQSDFFSRTLKRYQKYAHPNGVAIIDAGISEYWKYNDIVNEYKEKYASEDKNRYYIDTQAQKLTFALENDDFSHYDSLSMIKLGELFGECIAKVAVKK